MKDKKNGSNDAGIPNISFLLVFLLLANSLDLLGVDILK
jgi:hypothetical protein